MIYLLLVMALCHLCLSNNAVNPTPMLCMNDERQALLEFKRGLIDGSDRLASWVREDDSDCCKWVGIVCNNITGHVHKIHLRGHCRINDFSPFETTEECLKQSLRGDISPSLLNLKQLKHLDLSHNDFGGNQIPRFMGSLINLRYLNLSRSGFGGSVPFQLGNLSRLHTLSLGSFYEISIGDDSETLISMINMQWLSGFRFLRHLDLSGVDLSKAIDWLQVINTLPSLVELHLSNTQLINIHPHVASLNLTSLSLLDLSRNNFDNSFVPSWIFSLDSLVTLDLTWCYFNKPINPSDGFNNMTSLEFLHMSGNEFMNSSSVLKGLSGSSNLISLDVSDCGLSSLVLDSLCNLTSLSTLYLSNNLLTNKIPKSLGNLCYMRDIDLSGNTFGNISLTFLLESFFDCESPCLESINIGYSGLSGHLPYQIGQLINLVNLQLDVNNIVGTIPDSIGRLSFLKYLSISGNAVTGEIPFSIGGLLSLEVLSVSNNQLNGSLPHSLGLLSNLTELDISDNLLTGVVTDAHFANLNKLKYLKGTSNNLILRPRIANWHPNFRLEGLQLKSWKIGPEFPLWLLQQSNLMILDISNTSISSTMPLLFWRSFPYLRYLDVSQNYIQGRFLGIPTMLLVLDLSDNKFSGQLPKLSNSPLAFLDVSFNSFVGSLDYMTCPYGGERLNVLNLANNHLSGDIPDECWDQYPILEFLNLENNNLSGTIPRNLGSLASLRSLSLCNNTLSGTLPTSLKNLTNLLVLQLARNKFVGRIPAWFGTELSKLRFLNLRSNHFHGKITRELCYLTCIQILDLAHNNLSGNIPRCFNNLSTILSGKEALSVDIFNFLPFEGTPIPTGASLVIKGREDRYSTILGLVMIVDLSGNNLSGSIPSELMALRALQSLNLSRNQLKGGIPKNIGDMKSLVSFDVSLNQLSGELPMSFSRLSFLSSFNVSYNNFIGRIPTSTQLQSFNESSFFGNKLCGDPVTKSCVVKVLDSDHEEQEKNMSQKADWGLIISTMCGCIVGFWVVVVPLIVSNTWRIVYFDFMREMKYKVCDVIRKCSCNMFNN